MSQKRFIEKCPTVNTGHALCLKNLYVPDASAEKREKDFILIQMMGDRILWTFDKRKK
jgi:hypothetical protein